MFPVGAVMTIMKTSQVVLVGTSLILRRIPVLPQWEHRHAIID